MRILGVDPGLTVTGYGVIESAGSEIRLIDYGAIKPSPKARVEERISAIFTALNDVADNTRPEVMVLEKLYSHYKHPTTAVLMGHVRGAACLLAARKGIPVVGYSATMVKKSLTGSGHATKSQIQKMVQMLLNMKEQFEPADVADAVALAITYTRHRVKIREEA